MGALMKEINFFYSCLSTRGEQHALVSGYQKVPESWVDFQWSARLGSAFAETLRETEEAAEKSARLPDSEQAAALRRKPR